MHTWGQTLVRHVHLHCLVPGGAITAVGAWHPATSPYLFPVRALSRHFRGGFVIRLRRACEAGQLPRLRDRAEVDRTLQALMGTEWVVYSKPYLAATQTVVDYLGRYSHRIALSDSRILDFEDGVVSLSYKDDRDGDRRKVMTLTAEELLRCLLLHVLRKGFMRVRHFGFLANRCRAQHLAQIRTAFAAPAPELAETPAETGPFDGYPCPTCRAGRLHVTARLAPKRRIAPRSIRHLQRARRPKPAQNGPGSRRIVEVGLTVISRPFHRDEDQQQNAL